VFAALFAFWLAGERLAARGWLGAACIVAGMLVAALGRPAEEPVATPGEYPLRPAS
jgi:drug/metabolite transporter (DMT)-like permease